MSWNRFGMMGAVAAITMEALNAQCGRCGDGGGTERPPGYVVTSSFRSGVVAIPNRAGTISAGVTVRSELLKGATVPIGAGEIALSFSGVSGNSTVTGLEVRKSIPNSQNSAVVVEAVLGETPVALNGEGTIRRQGRLSPDSGPVEGRSSAYFLNVQLESGAWIKLDLRPAESQFVAIAPLAPLAEGSLNEGVGVLSATLARNASGDISSAEVRLDIQCKISTDLFNPARISYFGLNNGPASGAGNTTLNIIHVNSNEQIASRRLALPTVVRQFSSPQDLRNLENILRNPGGYHIVVGSDQPRARLGGAIQKADVQRAQLSGNPFLDSGAKADALVEVYVLREPRSANVLAGYASFDWVYRDLAVGDTVRSIKPYLQTTQINEFDALPPDWLFRENLNDLTVRDSVGGLSLRMPLPLDSPSLQALLAEPFSRFAGILVTDQNPNGAVQFSSVELTGQEPAPFIRSIEPPVTTPGSWITVLGSGFSEGSQVTIGGFDAVEVRWVDSTRLRARVAINTPTLPSNERPVVVIDPLGRTSNNVLATVDVVEPYIFSDAEGAAVFNSATPQQPVRAGARLKAGDKAEIRTTGFKPNSNNPRNPESGITVSVTIGDIEVPASVVQDINAPGNWTVQFEVPTGIPPSVDGKQSLFVTGVWTSPVTNSVWRFPSNRVDTWVEQR